eukprot:1159870-Pelagomonas_calceolata.AAC.13
MRERKGSSASSSMSRTLRSKQTHNELKNHQPSQKKPQKVAPTTNKASMFSMPVTRRLVAACPCLERT